MVIPATRGRRTPPPGTPCPYQQKQNAIIEAYQQECDAILDLYRRGQISEVEMDQRLDEAYDRENRRSDLLERMNGIGGAPPPGMACITNTWGDTITTDCF